MDRNSKQTLALLLLLMGIVTLCASGANLIGQTPSGQATGTRHVTVPAMVLLGASIISFIMGFYFFFQVNKRGGEL